MIEWDIEVICKTQGSLKEEDLVSLSQDALKDVCTGCYPRDCTAEEILEIYKTAF